MVVHFLGTSASPAMPIPFCVCEPCARARALGGKDLRKRSALLVDSVLLIDLGPDVAAASFDQRMPVDKVRWCLQTHAHSDHFDPSLLASRHPEWGTVAEPLVLVASPATIRALDTAFQECCDYGSLLDSAVQHSLRLSVRQASPYVAMTLGEYSVVPYPANHAPEQGALLYSIANGRQALFYGTDTAAIADAVWNDVLRRGAQYDLVVLDHTYGIGRRGDDHLCADEVAELAVRLRKNGIVRERGTVLGTHLSHEGIVDQARFDEHASARGYGIAYDGLTLTI